MGWAAARTVRVWNRTDRLEAISRVAAVALAVVATGACFVSAESEVDSRRSGASASVLRLESWRDATLPDGTPLGSLVEYSGEGGAIQVDAASHRVFCVHDWVEGAGRGEWGDNPPLVCWSISAAAKVVAETVVDHDVVGVDVVGVDSRRFAIWYRRSYEHSGLRPLEIAVFDGELSDRRDVFADASGPRVSTFRRYDQSGSFVLVWVTLTPPPRDLCVQYWPTIDAPGEPYCVPTNGGEHLWLEYGEYGPTLNRGGVLGCETHELIEQAFDPVAWEAVVSAARSSDVPMRCPSAEEQEHESWRRGVRGMVLQPWFRPAGASGVGWIEYTNSRYWEAFRVDDETAFRSFVSRHEFHSVGEDEACALIEHAEDREKWPESLCVLEGASGGGYEYFQRRYESPDREEERRVIYAIDWARQRMFLYASQEPI